MPKFVKHGMHDSPEYMAWRHMKDRCFNPRSQRYDRYGARGITVCREWKDSFEAFLRDVGRRPSPEHSLERLDNDGNYEPGNVVWATRDQQNANKSTNRYLEHDGERHTLAEWSKIVGIPTRTLLSRLHAGWTVEAALTNPVEKRPWNSGVRCLGVRRQRRESSKAARPSSLAFTNRRFA